MASVKVQDHRFPAGTKVRLVERVGDWFHAGAPHVKTATADKTGTVEFTGLDAGKAFWVCEDGDEGNVVATVAQDRVSRPKATEVAPELAAQNRPPQSDGAERVTGPRSTGNTKTKKGKKS